MRKHILIIFLILVSFVLIIAKDGRAQVGNVYRPEATGAQTVAMLYHRFRGMAPDFGLWASYTEEYQKAPKFDQVMIRDKKAQELQKLYSLLVPTDPIVINTTIALSEYSQVNKGYMITTFNDDLYFNFTYANARYAVVIPKLMDYQWVAVEGPAAEAIEKAARGNKDRLVGLTILLQANFADAAPMILDGLSYNLLATEVKNMAIYPADSNLMLWQRQNAAIITQQKNDLLNLRQ